MRHDDPDDLQNKPPDLDDGNLRDDSATTTHAPSTSPDHRKLGRVTDDFSAPPRASSSTCISENILGGHTSPFTSTLVGGHASPNSVYLNFNVHRWNTDDTPSKWQKRVCYAYIFSLI